LLSRRRSILLVDDELDIIKSVERWVEAAGFEVYGFVDPIQALKYFQNYSDHINLVLSDIRMQKMNGIEFVKKVKSIRPETKVILMTAFETDLPELSKTLPSVKIDGFMLKPGSLESLVDTIKKII
jgi:DNA-binding NtrC family response regulator